MYSLVVFFVSISFALWCWQPVTALNQNPLLLLISFDGFRYDLLNETLVPNIWKFAQQGVHYVNGVRPQFSTFTLPNHATMVTGLTVQDHGLVGNKFYDPINHFNFDVMNLSKTPDIVAPSLDGRFYKGEPIWLTNERAENGRRSASIQWPAGQAPYPAVPHKPQITRSWIDVGNLTKWEADFDYIMDLFLNQTVNFVAWYVEEPDVTLHENGFYYGNKLNETLQQLDQLFAYVISRINNETDLAMRLNIILTSDHGHAEINGTHSVMCLRDYIDITGVTYGDHMLYIEDKTRRDEIFDTLTAAIEDGKYGIDIYKKEDFPDRYHFANNIYVGDIIFVPHVGFAVSELCTKAVLDQMFQNDGRDFHKSTHGMDPDDWTMRPLLVMSGPEFKTNYADQTVVNNIDLYALMCFVLGVLEAPNNGSLAGLSSALYSPLQLPLYQSNWTRYLLPSLTIVLPIVCLISFYAIWMFSRSDKNVRNRSNEYRSISQSADSVGHSRSAGRTRVSDAVLVATSSEDEL